MTAMHVPDKLPYTKSEKTAETVCGAAATCETATEIILIVCGYLTGAAIIPLVVSLVVYGVFSLCSVYPQHTNLFTHPEDCTEEKFRKARRNLIIAKLILVTALFALTVIFRV